MDATLPHAVPVALISCVSYQRPLVEEAVRRCFDACELLSGLPRGARVLVKPNLLRASPLCCTHPEVVRAICLCLLERGLRVSVADSPGFGTARSVAAAIGLTEALRPLGLDVSSLDSAQAVRLGPRAGGGSWGVARSALESDHILSVPRVKAHCQMGLTLAVKNLFGCVCGLRKALAHTTQGDSVEMFANALLDLWAALPPSSGFADGVEAMHVNGPSGGEPFALGCLGASPSVVALDAALGLALGVEPRHVPLWAAARERRLPGSHAEDIVWPLAGVEVFDASGFILPELIDVSFRPHRLLWSLCRRVWSDWRS